MKIVGSVTMEKVEIVIMFVENSEKCNHVCGKSVNCNHVQVSKIVGIELHVSWKSENCNHVC